MLKPKSVHDALRRLHYLTLCVAQDLDVYRPGYHSLEYFEAIKDAALDAHLLVTWIKDNTTEGEKK